MQDHRRGQQLTIGVIVVGFLIGVWVASILFAANSAQCEHMDRSLTLFPPGLRCFGVKDGVRHIPWSSADSNPINLVPIVVLGGGIGALVLGLILTGVRQRLRRVDTHETAPAHQ